MDTKPSAGKKAADWLRSVATLLEGKAESYGDSIGHPVSVFYKGSSKDGIRARLDDKIARIKHGKSFPGDDNLKDLVGYTALLATTDEE